mmetsp:Transcript_1906/g.1944  ORF Transcript_1906/g.1944 Transcript_1906/m.1944 type:complete len:81 (-) Transcript_1906:7-249(-)
MSRTSGSRSNARFFVFPDIVLFFELLSFARPLEKKEMMLPFNLSLEKEEMEHFSSRLKKKQAPANIIKLIGMTIPRINPK